MFDKITKFLFRRRTAFLPFATIAMLILAKPGVTGFVVGLALALIGESMRIWSAGHLVKSDVLTMTGPFQWVRNPLYVGSFVIACGYCSMTGGWIVWAIAVPMFLATHCSAVHWEEKFLLEKFGEPFAEYCRRVPRWIPRPPARDIRSDVPFSFERMKLNSEQKTIFGTLLVVAVFAVRLWFAQR